MQIKQKIYKKILLRNVGKVQERIWYFDSGYF
jgi:hypothetical protein